MKARKLILWGISATLFASGPVFADPQGFAFCPFGVGGMMGWGGLLLGLFVLLLVAYFAIRLLGESAGRGRNNEPLEILKERYARGEISEDEYQRMKAELER
ncbi:SHOCT domain-containing protein [Candidatus Caldatribacterium sp. SIUC1]|uniref:SHOCT domain-containing protein n=1 Tax=Candidatus Caldatribacterium sp. SIUC1 TaxID=3418365 RepID=UPI003F692989